MRATLNLVMFVFALTISAVDAEIISVWCFVLISLRVVSCGSRDQMCHFSGLSLCNLIILLWNSECFKRNYIFILAGISGGVYNHTYVFSLLILFSITFSVKIRSVSMFQKLSFSTQSFAMWCALDYQSWAPPWQHPVLFNSGLGDLSP